MSTTFYSFQYDFPHVVAYDAKAVRITLPHIKNQRRGGDIEDKVDISVPGSALHLDGELFPITHPNITFR